jgi:biopolymer transport protein TolR
LRDFNRNKKPGSALTAFRGSVRKEGCMSMIIGNKGGPRSEINVTPYIDILLVLLIIFMVVTPIDQKDLKVKVPQPPQPPTIESRPGDIVVSVGDHAEIEINRIPVALSALSSKLHEIFSARPNKNMFISASPGLPYGDVVKVIDISKGAGVADIGLICEELH